MQPFGTRLAAHRCWAGAALGLLEHHSCRAGIWYPSPPRGLGVLAQDLGCRVPWCVTVDVWGELGPGLEHRDVVLSAATAPCASEGASSALEQDPAQHKWLLEPLRCLGKWLGIALTAGELCWGIGPLQHTQHPSPLQCLQHPPPLDALSILLFSDTLSVLSQCRLLPGRPSLEVPLCPKMAMWAGEGWAGRTILSPRWDLPHTWRALS